MSSLETAIRQQPLRALAAALAGGEHFNLNSVFVTAAGDLTVERPGRPARCKFRLDGLSYAMALTPDDEGCALALETTVGYVPFTAHGGAAREATRRMLDALGTGQAVNIAAEDLQAIILRVDDRVEGAVTPVAVIAAIVEAVGRARAYVRLVQEALPPSLIPGTRSRTPAPAQ